MSLLWDYSRNNLKAKVENSTYTQVSSQDGQSMSSDSKTQWTSLNTLVPNAIINTYSYSPFVGMTSQTDPTGVKTTYTYDLFGRLEYIKNNGQNLLKKYVYHFYNQ